MIQIIVQAQKASCRKSSGERITTGMVGKQVSFDFSAEWDGLVKTVVFEGNGVTKDVALSGDTAVIPHECLTAPGGMLRVGMFGTDGTIQTPTVYTDIGQIEQGADPSGDTSADPTLPIWAQLQAMMGSLDNLTTTARDNLVAAINEAAKSGGGGAAADVRMQVAGGYIQYSSDGGKSWVNLIALSELIGPTDETLTKSGQAADAAVVGNRLNSLSEEMLTEESDPTVPAWAKEAQKPSYTASEVGADPSGTAAAQVAAHNSGTDTHSDIRVLIQGLTDRLNALADSDDTTLDQLSEVVAYIKSNRSLIEAITTSKVSVADIVDNLTTNVSNKPLSAAQGVALKALIDAITVPDALPNPHPLTFTGAVTGSYDGSEPLTVEIPSGGSGGSDAWNLIDHFTVADAAISYAIPLQPGAKEYGIYWNYTQPSGNIPKRSIMVDSSLAQYGVMYRCVTNETLFLRVFKGPSNILVTGQGVGYTAQRFSNGGTNIGSGTDFPAMTLTTDITCATSEIWVYWR